jgi:cysteine desulfurase
VKRLYFDWNATTPPLPAAIEAMREAALEAWANPSSVHAHGRAARARLEDARSAVAELAEADPRDVVFTSGGTEANNLALRSAFVSPVPGFCAVLVTSRLEHPSVTRVVEALEHEGRARARWVNVSEGGTIDLEDAARAIAEPDVKLVALQAVNHETGVRQPVADVLAMARARGVLVHVDAVQAFGRTDAIFPDADTRALASHKIRGPKGIGALIVRPGTRLHPLLLGGAQERGLRPGTLDPIAAAGLAAAAKHGKTGPARYLTLEPLRDELEQALLALYPRAERVASAPRAPHVANVAFPGWIGAELVAALDLEGLSVSSGSACSAGTIEPSPVVRAIRGEALAAASVRFSLGEETVRNDVRDAVGILRRVLGRRPVHP